jgi:hypothetical protein
MPTIEVEARPEIKHFYKKLTNEEAIPVINEFLSIMKKNKLYKLAFVVDEKTRSVSVTEHPESQDRIELYSDIVTFINKNQIEGMKLNMEEYFLKHTLVGIKNKDDEKPSYKTLN